MKTRVLLYNTSVSFEVLNSLCRQGKRTLSAFILFGAVYVLTFRCTSALINAAVGCAQREQLHWTRNSLNKSVEVPKPPLTVPIDFLAKGYRIEALQLSCDGSESL